jgi:hypothetical protein
MKIKVWLAVSEGGKERYFKQLLKITKQKTLSKKGSARLPGSSVAKLSFKL